MSRALKTTAYKFAYSTACNMCGTGSELQRFFGWRLDRRQGFFPKPSAGISVSIFRCATCGLLYPNPMPVPERFEQHYDIAPEEYWGKAAFEVYLPRQIDTFTKLSGLLPRSCSALDIGAGSGNMMRALLRAGFDVYGIEPSSSFRRAAIERAGVPEQRLQLTSVEAAEFERNSFDFINFGAVVEHLVDPAAALDKSVQWLKPHGLMYVEVPSSAFLLSRMVRWFYRLTGGGKYVINTCPMHAPFHLYEFGLQSFLHHGAKARYAVAFHEYFPCAYPLVPRWAVRPFNAAMKWTNTGMQLAVWLRPNPC